MTLNHPENPHGTPDLEERYAEIIVNGDTQSILGDCLILLTECRRRCVNAALNYPDDATRRGLGALVLIDIAMQSIRGAEAGLVVGGMDELIAESIPNPPPSTLIHHREE